MSNNPTESLRDTVRLLRPPPRVYTAPRGQSVWMGEVEKPDLELVIETADCDPYNNT